MSITAGVALLAFMAVDVFRTVFMLGGGAGPQTMLLADRIWRGALRLHDPHSVRSHSALRAAGPSILLTALVVWFAELTVAWALVHVPEAFRSPSVGITDRLVYAAKLVVGRGENAETLVAGAGPWDELGSFAGATGVVFASLLLAYVLPVLQAVADKRATAAHVRALGGSAQAMREMVRATADGARLTWHLNTLTTAILTTAERHRAYPVLHYFHSRDPHAALAPAVATLARFVDDGVPDAPSVDEIVLHPLVRAVHDLLGALQDMGLERFAEQAGEVDAAALDAGGAAPRAAFPVSSPSEAWLRAYVAFDGWDWDAVVEHESELQHS